jgi:hypothetical protein
MRLLKEPDMSNDMDRSSQVSCLRCVERDAGAVLSDADILEIVRDEITFYASGVNLIDLEQMLRVARAILASAPKEAVPEAAALARKDALLRQAMEALLRGHDLYANGPYLRDSITAAIRAELKEQDK